MVKRNVDWSQNQRWARTIKRTEFGGDFLDQIGGNPLGEIKGRKLTKEKEPKTKVRQKGWIGKLQAGTLEGVCWDEGALGAQQVHPWCADLSRVKLGDESAQVNIASRYLKGEAYNWFILVGRIKQFKDWEDFKQRLREYFIPRNEPFKLRDEYRNLTQESRTLKSDFDRDG